MWIQILVLVGCWNTFSLGDPDPDDSRKILGSSVVTSVSVIMDSENGTGATFSDAVGKPVAKPPVTKLASPIELLNPDRYEFYTFDESGDLVKRLMTLQEIKAIIATSGDDVFDIDNLDIMPEKRVNDIVSTVQNVLREEMESHKLPDTNQLFDTPDVSDSWSMILPAIFGNSGDDIRPERIATGSTPETIILQPTQTEPTTKKLPPPSTTPKLTTLNDFLLESVKTSTGMLSTSSTPSTFKQTTNQPEMTPGMTTQRYDSPTRETTTIKVQIFPNSNTNHLEEPYSKLSTSGTTTRQDYISTRTPKPELPMESRVSSTILEQTSPSSFITIESRNSPATPLTDEGNSKISTTEISSPVPTVTPTTGEGYKTSETKRSTPSTTNTLPVQSITTSKVLSESTSVEPMTQQTEKIYILVRPIPSANTNISTTTKTIETSEKKTYTTTSNAQTPSSTTQAIFTVSSQKPTIVSVASKPQSTTGANTASTSTKIYSTTSKYSTKSEDVEDTSLPGLSTSSITEFLSYLTSSPSVKQNTTLPTLAQILNSKVESSQSLPSSTEYPPFSTSQSVTSDTSSRVSTRSDAHDMSTLSENEPSTSNDISTTYSTNPETTYIRTEPNFTEEPTTEKLQTVLNDTIVMNKDILQQLLLSSTNVYEINSAINEAVTDSLDSTSTSDDFTSTLPTQNNDQNAVGNETLLESFSHLLAQAVNNVNGVILKENVTSPPPTTFAAYTDSQTTSEPSTVVFESTTNYIRDTDSTNFSQLTEKDVTKFQIATESPVKENISYINVPLYNKRNMSKPAKADLSLEQDYDMLNFNHTEMHKLVQNKFQVSPLPTTQKSVTAIDELPSTSTEANTGLEQEESQGTTLDDINTSIKYMETTRYETTDPTEFTESEQNGQTTLVPSTTRTKTETTSSPSLSSISADTEKGSWTLVSTIAPHSKLPLPESKPSLAPFLEPTPTVDLSMQPMQGFGLEESTANLEYDVYQFIQLCNELAFGFWKSVTTGISTARSVIVSPFAATSLLAMVFLGARGATSGEMNEILKLDNMVTFNPHLIFKTITESITTGGDSGVATSAILRQLYSDKSREVIQNFYKERARFFYDGHVEEVSFKDIGDTIRRRTNLLVKKQTNGKLQEFLKDGSVRVRSPLAAVSASVMQTDCTKGSISDRDGELHFVVFPSLKQRRLIPIPAVVYRRGFLAGYEPSLDATAVALGEKDDNLSFIFVLPGKQGINAMGDGLARLEKRLVESSFQKGAWSRLLRSLVPRPGLEVQIPRFSHRSIINATSALKQMGLKSLFDLNKADLRGLNGVAHDLYLSDMLQFNYFSVCGSTNTVNNHHSEYYPATSRRSLRKHRRLDLFEQQKILHDDPLFIIDYLSLPLNLRPRQARVPQNPRLRLDRPFLYFVRHNPTGLILHMGRFNPRLLP
ncbi:mucin-3A [Coccinella septempunctata]|uniref:mucin-3A n=1 Tax=Coccinella septempunctata TaxID=41139 RepID=UPI001D069744|nr:mucin-3A [Coccinella septempunctata]